MQKKEKNNELNKEGKKQICKAVLVLICAEALMTCLWIRGCKEIKKQQVKTIERAKLTQIQNQHS